MTRNQTDEIDLTPFHDAIAALRDGDEVVGYVATIVGSFRGLFLMKADCVWLLVSWLDGTRERIEEDYRPWAWVAELADGHLEVERRGRKMRLSADWVTGPERESLWGQFGILEPVGAYM